MALIVGASLASAKTLSRCAIVFSLLTRASVRIRVLHLLVTMVADSPDSLWSLYRLH